MEAPIYIKESNYWDPRSDMLDECDGDGENIDGASEAFIHTSFEVARSLGMISISNGKKEKRRELLTKSQRKKMDERRAKFHGLQQLPEGEDSATKNELRTEIRQYQRKRWLEWTTKPVNLHSSLLDTPTLQKGSVLIGATRCSSCLMISFHSFAMT